jgi:hypothetical protein
VIVARTELPVKLLIASQLTRVRRVPSSTFTSSWLLATRVGNSAGLRRIDETALADRIAVM